MATREETARAIRQGMFASVPQTFMWYINEIIERDTPKEPNESTLTIKSRYDRSLDINYTIYKCSECGEVICTEDSNKNDYNFCSKCGQKVRWE